jgi:hypothetical protein
LFTETNTAASRQVLSRFLTEVKNEPSLGVSGFFILAVQGFIWRSSSYFFGVVELHFHWKGG